MAGRVGGVDRAVGADGDAGDRGHGRQDLELRPVEGEAPDAGGVRDDERAVGIGGHAAEVDEAAPAAVGLAGVGERLDAAVLGVGDVDPAVRVDGERRSVRPERPGTAAGVTEDGQQSVRPDGRGDEYDDGGHDRGRKRQSLELP